MYPPRVSLGSLPSKTLPSSMGILIPFTQRQTSTLHGLLLILVFRHSCHARRIYTNECDSVERKTYSCAVSVDKSILLETMTYNGNAGWPRLEPRMEESQREENIVV